MTGVQTCALPIYWQRSSCTGTKERVHRHRHASSNHPTPRDWIFGPPKSQCMTELRGHESGYHRQIARKRTAKMMASPCFTNAAADDHPKRGMKYLVTRTLPNRRSCDMTDEVFDTFDIDDKWLYLLTSGIPVRNLRSEEAQLRKSSQSSLKHCHPLSSVLKSHNITSSFFTNLYHMKLNAPFVFFNRSLQKRVRGVSQKDSICGEIGPVGLMGSWKP